MNLFVRINKRIRAENGQALLMSLLFLAVGALLVGAFLSYGSTNLIATKSRHKLVDQQYAADAGIEDAILGLLEDTYSATLVDTGDSINYILVDTVNSINPDITITRIQPFLSRDDFESGGFVGGLGWLAPWQTQGDADVVVNYLPYEGSNHMQFNSNTGYAKRSVNLLGKAGVHLQFWAKANAFEAGDEAECLVSSNGVDWDIVKTWVEVDADNTYYFYDIDLSAYSMTSEFWIAFDANMTGQDDWIFIDDIVMKTVTPGSITPPTDDFESGGWTGGFGWLDNWTDLGNSIVTMGQSPYEGQEHVQMRNAGSSITRTADLSGQSGLSLQFWAKVRSLGAANAVDLLVSSDGLAWDVAYTWTVADSDNTYHFYDVDLSPYTMSSQFHFKFDSRMTKNNEYFYIDDLTVAGTGGGVSPDAIPYKIVSVANSITVTSTVAIDGAAVGIISWSME